jgi:hypothetical protein
MKDYKVDLDGNELSVLTLVNMAKRARNQSVVEHYLVTLLYAANKHEDNWLFLQCQDIMENIGISSGPDSPASEGNLPNDPSLEDEARRYFNGLTEGNQLNLLRKAMTLLRDRNIFNKKQHWIGVFLVLRDKLFGYYKQNHFTEYAKKFTPDDYPEELKIGTIMTNASKTVSMDKLYYDMKNNPYETVCDEFWNTILSLIRPNLTKI